MFQHAFFAPIAIAICAIFVSSAPADENGADAAASPVQIAEWIAELDNDDFATREAAQLSLQKAGKPALDALGKAAMGDSQEAGVRAIEILKRHFRGEDDSLKQAAEAALKKISAADNTIAAGRANNALQPEPEKPEVDPKQATPFGPRVIPFGGRGGIRIEARAIAIGGRGAKRVSVKNVDGNKEIEVEEEKRSIKINETAEGKIKMEITAKDKGDMDGTEKYEAENAEALKKNHPEAYKVYEQYSKGGGGARIEFRALPAAPGPGGAIPRIKVLPALPRALPAERVKRLDEARKRLEEAQKQMKKAIEEAGKAEGLIPADVQFDAIIKQLEEVRGQIEANDAIPAEAKELIKQSLKELEAEVEE